MKARPLAVLALTFLATLASASEPLPQRAERLSSPGRSTAGEDSSEALVLNPAHLGNQPAAELRWTGLRCTDTERVACGHAVNLATPVLWGLGTGLRVDYVLVPDGRDGPPFPYN